jgi:uncharacterized protein (TIGR03084 family)
VREELTDLAAEQREFAALLETLGDADWTRASAADGWTVADQVAHLADTEEVAADTLVGGARAFARAVAQYPTAEDFTAAGCRRGGGLSPQALVGWWAGASTRTRELMAQRAPQERVAWGLGMTTHTFVTARLMEHWAHGLDIRDALGLPVGEPRRLRHIAALGLSTLRYALARARESWPQDRTLRLELRAADGDRHTFGSADATDVLRGGLLEWCRIATQRSARRGAPTVLAADGELAELAVLHARAFL